MPFVFQEDTTGTSQNPIMGIDVESSTTNLSGGGGGGGGSTPWKKITKFLLFGVG
jgi:hypothetical protein